MDVIFAFSVFTHLSKSAAERAFNIFEKQLKSEGIVVLTIRNINYWRLGHGIPIDEARNLYKMHQTDGFAYRPHQAGGDYGDTSMDVDFFERAFPKWEVVMTDVNMVDAWQNIIVLKMRR